MSPIHNTYRIFALTMAFLMFFSSVGFSIDMHFCQGNLTSFSLIGKAKTCPAKTKVVKSFSSQVSQNCQVTKKNCCESKTLRIQSDQDQKVQSIDFVANQELQPFLVAYIAVLFQNTLVETNKPNFALYKSPYIPRDISALYETFLL